MAAGALAAKLDGMPPLILLLVAATVFEAWRLAQLLGRRYGKAYGAVPFVFITVVLLVLCCRAYGIQQECFARKAWTAGAMVWVEVAVPSSCVFLACAVARRLLNRSA